MTSCNRLNLVLDSSQVMISNLVVQALLASTHNSICGPAASKKKKEARDAIALPAKGFSPALPLMSGCQVLRLTPKRLTSPGRGSIPHQGIIPQCYRIHGDPIRPAVACAQTTLRTQAWGRPQQDAVARRLHFPQLPR